MPLGAAQGTVGLLARRSHFWFIRGCRFRPGQRRIVVSQPFLDRFSLRQSSHPLPAGAASPNGVLGHQVVVRVINVNYLTGVGTLAVKGVRDIRVVTVLH